MITPTRPIVRYHGGKWRLAPWIISHFPAHRVYVEPFGGGGSVLLRKGRSYAEVYNDLDAEIVNLFRVARDEGRELVRRIRLTPFARDEYISAFKDVSDPIERARLTVIRAYMGFWSNSINRMVKSGFRANTKRSHTIPSHDWAGFPECLVTIMHRLHGVVVENRDAVEVMEAQDGPETLHYVDPPYVHSTRMEGAAEHGYAHEMTDDQHRALAEVLRSLKGMVIVSGYPSDLYMQLFADWRRDDMAARADGARERTECLWMNPAASCVGLFTTSPFVTEKTQ